MIVGSFGNILAGVIRNSQGFLLLTSVASTKMKRWTTLPVSVRHRDPREVGPGKMDGLSRTAKHEVSAKDIVNDVDKQLHIILRFNKIAKLIEELNGTLRI